MYQFEKPAKDSEVIVMKTNMGTIKTVSYTHLTLPTKLEV